MENQNAMLLILMTFLPTLGGLLVWRGFAWLTASGRTIAPMDATFQLLGGGSSGSLGETGSWIVGGVACVGIVAQADIAVHE